MATIPPLKRFEQGNRLHVQAQQIWLILVAFVMHSARNPAKPETMSYGALAEAMGRERRAGHTLGRPLSIIGKFCALNKLPPLNTLVVNQDDEEPGDAVFVRKGRTVEQEQAEVMQVNWFEWRVPTTGTFRKVWEKHFAR